MNAQGAGPAREWSLITAMLALAVLPPLAVAVAVPLAAARWGTPGDALMPVVFVLIAVFGAVAAFHRLPGRAVRPRDEPELATLVRDVAERLSFREPLLVRVVPEVAASLHRAKVSGVRAYVLVLGLPLLRTLTADELAAVVAHELAHEQHVAHRRTAWLLRSRHLLEAWLAPRLRPLAPVATPLLRATQPRAWRTETDADADAARVTSTRATTTALERTALLDAVFNGLGRHWWSALAQNGTYPQDFYAALDTATQDPHVAVRAAGVAAEREAADPYATADHPPITARLTALAETAPVAVRPYDEKPRTEATVTAAITPYAEKPQAAATVTAAVTPYGEEPHAEATDTAAITPHAEATLTAAITPHSKEPQTEAPVTAAITPHGEEPLPLRTAGALERWCVEQLLAQHTARKRRRPRRGKAEQPHPVSLLALPADRLRELLHAEGPGHLRSTEALEAALDAVAAGTWPRLARRVEPRIRQVPASVRRTFARDALADAMIPPVTEALRAAGWTHASRWRTSVLTAPDGTTLDIGDTLTAALDGDDPAPVRALLAQREAAV
ncbi:M48 family metallopeptidase [Streptomyces justiciae]|uniref:M48 family metallopeptidase n=1 Tax=Streptomyces justiciae TaxID=2780140 RepID=UPI0018820DA0|nr:M48 family metallopeptidase [Streptomyces justiciae]MBE8474463.1 M48 family metallopeptidase [Streptomyces justiciae]